MNFAHDPVAAANILLRQNRTIEAMSIIDRAVRAGDRDATFQQAIWRLIGNFMPRDLAAARRELVCARELGHVGAAFMEVALTANGSGSEVNWPRALKLLRDIAVEEPLAQHNLNLIAAMDLDEHGYPRAAAPFEQLDATGLVLRYPKLLSPAECSHLVQASVSFLKPAGVIDPETGLNVPHPIRTSYGAVIGPTREDLVVGAINRRLGAITATFLRCGEALTVLRYGKGQQFRIHLDAIEGASNQRCYSVLVYLNEDFQGGTTVFPELDLEVMPRRGDAIAFSNVRADGSIEYRVRHAGLPVEDGVKWLATRWIRCKPVDPWTN